MSAPDPYLNTDTALRPEKRVPHARATTSRWPLASHRSGSLLARGAMLWNISNRTLAALWGHWKSQISAKSQTVSFGPAFRRLPDGSLQPESRTIERSKRIDNLLATRPWADRVDIQIFLEGFDAGEQWCLGNQDLGSAEDKLSGA
jgi:hypothetical protein